MYCRVQRALASRRGAQCCLLALTLNISACQTDGPTKAVIPDLIPAAQFRPMAFTASVDLRTGRVTIAAPTARGPSAPTISREGADAPSLSLLGGDAVRLVPTNYVASPVGTYAPNRIRVTFDVTIENKLTSVAFTTPTWPQPPSSGVILFPLDFMIRGTPGDTTGGADTLLVEPPNPLMVVPSVEWNGTGVSGSGAPFSFFNDVGCAGATSDECFRWIAYEGSIPPTSRSSTRSVGFDIDATVDVFSARMIVAGDLVAVPPPPSLKIARRVMSAHAGSLARVGVPLITVQ